MDFYAKSGSEPDTDFRQAAPTGKGTQGVSSDLTRDSIRTENGKPRRKSLVTFDELDPIHFKTSSLAVDQSSRVGPPGESGQGNSRWKRRSLIDIAGEPKPSRALEATDRSSGHGFTAVEGGRPTGFQKEANAARQRDSRDLTRTDGKSYRRHSLLHFNDLELPSGSLDAGARRPTAVVNDEQRDRGAGNIANKAKQKRSKRESLLAFDKEEIQKLQSALGRDSKVSRAVATARTENGESGNFASGAKTGSVRSNILSQGPVAETELKSSSKVGERSKGEKTQKATVSLGKLQVAEDRRSETVISMPNSASSPGVIKSPRYSVTKASSAQLVSPRHSGRNRRMSIIESIDVAANRPLPVIAETRLKRHDKEQRETEIQKIAPKPHKAEISQEIKGAKFSLQSYVRDTMSRSIFWRELYSSILVFVAISLGIVAVASPYWIQYQLELSNPNKGLYVGERITNGLWSGVRCFNSSCNSFSLRQECTNLTWGFANKTYPQNSDFDYFNRLFDLDLCNRFLLLRWFTIGLCALLLLASILQIVVLTVYRGDKLVSLVMIPVKLMKLKRRVPRSDQICPQESPGSESEPFAALHNRSDRTCCGAIRYKLRKCTPRLKFQVYTVTTVNVLYFHALLYTLLLAVCCGIVATALQVNVATHTEGVLRSKGALWIDHTMVFVFQWSFIFLILSWVVGFLRCILFWPGVPEKISVKGATSDGAMPKDLKVAKNEVLNL